MDPCIVWQRSWVEWGCICNHCELSTSSPQMVSYALNGRRDCGISTCNSYNGRFGYGVASIFLLHMGWIFVLHLRESKDLPNTMQWSLQKAGQASSDALPVPWTKSVCMSRQIARSIQLTRLAFNFVDKRRVDADAVVLACGPKSTKNYSKPLGIGDLQPIHQQYASTIDVALSSNPGGTTSLHHRCRTTTTPVYHRSFLNTEADGSSWLDLICCKVNFFTKWKWARDSLHISDERLAGWRQHIVNVREQAKIPDLDEKWKFRGHVCRTRFVSCRRLALFRVSAWWCGGPIGQNCCFKTTLLNIYPPPWIPRSMRVVTWNVNGLWRDSKRHWPILFIVRCRHHPLARNENLRWTVGQTGHGQVVIMSICTLAEKRLFRCCNIIKTTIQYSANRKNFPDPNR